MRIFKLLALMGLMTGLSVTTEVSAQGLPVVHYETAFAVHQVELHADFITSAEIATTKTLAAPCPAYGYLRDIRKENKIKIHSVTRLKS
jgi:hypothetical protein